MCAGLQYPDFEGRQAIGKREPMVENKVRAAMQRGEFPIQVFHMSGSTYLANAVAGLGFDSMLVDLQHGPTTMGDLFDLVMVIGPELCPMVRVPSSEIGVLEKAVEAGVHGVICPSVDTPQEAERLVAACRTSRSVDVMAIAQIESVPGFDALEAIVSTPGLDALLPGPSDLSVAYGGPPGLDYTGEASIRRLRHIIDVAHDHGLKVTLPATDRVSFETILGWGIDWVTFAGDTVWVPRAGSAVLAEARDVLATRP